MRKLFLVLSFMAFGLFAASLASAETKTVPAYCELGPKKIVTNVVTVTVDVDTSSDNALYVVQKVAQAIANKASQTLYAMGINSEGLIGCRFSDPTLMTGNENQPLDYLRAGPDRDVGFGYRLVTVSGFGEAEPQVSADDTAPASSAQSHIYFCDTTLEVKDHPYLAHEVVPSRDVYAIVETTLPKEELARQWAATAPARTIYAPDCWERRSRADAEGDVKDSSERGIAMERIDFVPKESAPAGSKLKTKSVLFRPAHGSERGYRGVTFDVEYQFIVCSGELHIAYSVVEDSVRKAHNNIGSDLYSVGGHLYKVASPPTTIVNLPLKGRVFYSFLHASTIGTFADDHAGKALGFGCFSGQSQKIADVKDLRDENGGIPSKEYLPKVLDLLDVSFETTQVLTSAEAEDEIRAGISKQAAAKDEQAAKSAEERPQTDQGPSEANLRAQRRAAEEAEFQAKQKAYEDGMAEHQAAVEQYQKALADMEAQKAANAAAAKAQQEEFARKQAAYEAEAARAKQAQDEYEAKYGKPQ